MGRPSRIRLHIDVSGGAISTARIGGQAVKIRPVNFIFEKQPLNSPHTFF